MKQTDRNLQLRTAEGQEITWIEVKGAPFSFHGFSAPEEQGRFFRLPQSLREEPSVNEDCRLQGREPTGGRVRFSTDSPVLALRCEYEDRVHFPQMSLLGVGGFDLYWDSSLGSRFHFPFVPPENADQGYDCGEMPLFSDGKMRFYTLNFPLYQPIRRLWIGIRPGAKLGEGKPYSREGLLLFYGSSITKGGCCSRPGNSYPAAVSRRLDMDYVNLGFGGACLGEAAMLSYAASLHPRVFVYDYDHNAPSVEHLQNTHRRGFEIFRRENPFTPVVFLTKPDWLYGSHQQNDNYVAMRRNVIYQSYEAALQAGDRNVAFVDGRSFFAQADRELCTVDGTHPGDYGMHCMAQAVTDAVKFLLYEKEPQ